MKKILFFLSGLLLWCCFWLFLCFKCSVWTLVVSIVIEAAVATIALLWMLFLRPWPMKSTTRQKLKFKWLNLFLAALMVWLPCYCASAKSTVTPVPIQTKPKLVAEIGVGLGILIAGGVICIGLKKISGVLNPPPTNCPIQVPIIPPIIIIQMKPSTQTGTSGMVFNFDDSGVQEYDIYGSNWMDGSGFPFTAYFKTTIQSCGDLKSWTNECSVVGYRSPFNVLTYWYDSNGMPFWTNYCSNTNEVMCPDVEDNARPSKFFRAMSSP